MKLDHDARAPAIELSRVSKTFGNRAALYQVNLTIQPGEMVALIGPSGAGKSTLLRHISGLAESDRTPSRITVHGRHVQQHGRVSRQIRCIRADIGFIFQQFNLVGRMPLLMNVLIGNLARTPSHRRQLRWFTHQEKLAAMRALHFVGMADFAAQRASTLSGGQQQRGAIARAVMQGAKVILADEPIASLDPESARLVMDGLRRINRREGATVLVSVHQIEHFTQGCDRMVGMRDGRIVFDGPATDLDDTKLRAIYGTSEPQRPGPNTALASRDSAEYAAPEAAT
jgi:phosphonate transport system ATP-binding protein